MNAEKPTQTPPAAGDAPTAGSLQPPADRFNELAARLRKGELDDKMLDAARAATEELRGFGRAFTAEDKARLQKLARELPPQPAPEMTVPDRPTPAPQGRARTALTGGQGPGEGRVVSRPGEMSEDELRRVIEAGQAKVVPEYRKPVEDYYKAVSK